ncbi:MAG: MmcQ/YjbR family DNA-binding protein [Bacilli bacterium]
MQDLFKNKCPEISKLLSYGFIRKSNLLIFEKKIHNDEFTLQVEVNDKSNTSFKLIENAFKEEFVLFALDSYQGDYVFSLRKEAIAILDDIIAKCYYDSFYKTQQARNIALFIKDNYDDVLTPFPGDEDYCYTVKRKDTKKWYLLLLKVQRGKIDNSASQEPIEVICLKGDIDTIDNEVIFPGFHMNKKHWISIILDNSLPDNALFSFIELSYQLAR